mmetsp:Transcript_45169/g.66480  ORF Transcript_45169/g.66480 Transcript_45169/m.66480 type:complete len:515 (+) Transcript_45169:246-1790(+)
MKRRSSRNPSNTRGMRYRYPAEKKKRAYFGSNNRRIALVLIAFVVAFVICNVTIHHVLGSNERSSSSSRFPMQMLRRQQQQQQQQHDPVDDGQANHVRFLPPQPPQREEEEEIHEDKNIGSIREDNNNNNNNNNNSDKMIREDSLWYRSIRDKYDDLVRSSESNNGNSHNRQRQVFAQSMRKRAYQPIEDGSFDNDGDCPFHPASGYPKAWNTMEIIQHWNPDDTTPPQSNQIYQGICVFDYEKDYQKAMNYRNAEVPFVLRDHPQVLDTVRRWNQPGYLSELLRNEPYQTEHSTNNHFMYWNKNRYKDGKQKAPKGWNPPIENIRMTFDEWQERANVQDPEKLGVDREHWYFRLKGTDHPKSRFLYEELMFFQPVESFFTVVPRETRGINCRFGMKGVIAENHFDGSRNWVALLGGERRYILSHPNQCQNLALYPKEHPSGRHSAVDWSNPDVNLYPQFRSAKSNEIVLQAGDALYLPTQWFHYIISLETNYQCNARSGVTFEYKDFIHDCGF